MPLAEALVKQEVCLCPTLTREVSTFVYESEPDFFKDPFFLREADPGVLELLKDPQRQKKIREDKSAQHYKKALETASANLKKLADAGVNIVFGTDTGPPARFQGYFEHLELELMVQCRTHAHAGDRLSYRRRRRLPEPTSARLSRSGEMGRFSRPRRGPVGRYQKHASAGFGLHRGKSCTGRELARVSSVAASIENWLSVNAVGSTSKISHRR